MSSVFPDSARGAWLSIFTLVILVSLGLFLGSALVGILSVFTGIGIDADLLSEGKVATRMLVRVYLMVNQICTFIIPAYLFLKFFGDKSTHGDLFTAGAARRIPVIFLSICLLFSSLPVVLYSYELNTQLIEWVNWSPDGSSMPRVLQDILNMEIPPELFMNIVLVALIPAIGEELIFRGLLLKLLQKATHSIHLGIWLSAIIFSAFHFQVEGFLPRMVLGLILGYLFHWTRTIWIPMLIHFLNNGFQVMAIYYDMEQYSEINLQELPPVPPIIVVASAICIYLSARLILRYARQSI